MLHTAIANTASVFPPDLSGLGGLLSLLLVLLAAFGLAVIALAIYVVLDERVLSSRETDQFKFEPGPIDRGVALLDYANENTLRSLAKLHEIEEPPTSIEQEQRSGASASVPKEIFKKTSESGTKVTHQPHDDLGDLILKVLRHLDDHDQLSEADLIDAEDILSEPLLDFSDRTGTRRFFESWLKDNFADGLDGVQHEELATKLADMHPELTEENLSTRLRASFEELKQDADSVLFLEGEWKIEGEVGNLVLRRTDLRVEAADDGAPKSIRMPSGASISARIEGQLTDHGKNRMVGQSQPIRASVLASIRQYNPDTGCLEIAPIGVFQRVLGRSSRAPSTMLGAFGTAGP